MSLKSLSLLSLSLSRSLYFIRIHQGLDIFHKATSTSRLSRDLNWNSYLVPPCRSSRDTNASSPVPTAMAASSFSSPTRVRRSHQHVHVLWRKACSTGTGTIIPSPPICWLAVIGAVTPPTPLQHADAWCTLAYCQRLPALSSELALAFNVI